MRGSRVKLGTLIEQVRRFKQLHLSSLRRSWEVLRLKVLRTRARAVMKGRVRVHIGIAIGLSGVRTVGDQCTEEL